MKRILLFIIICTIFTTTVSAKTNDNPLVEQNVTIDKLNHNLILTKEIYEELNLPATGDITIPDCVRYRGEDYTVVGIGYSTFSHNDNITSITLPGTIITIGDYAFDGCSRLRSINFPDGLLYIGQAAFQLCSALEHIELPDTVYYIGNFAFNHCSGVLDKEFRIPAELESLGPDLHYPAHAFYNYGKDFTDFYVPEENQYFKSDCGILYTKDGKTLISIPKGKKYNDGMYVMPNTIKNLGELSFSRNPNIKYVVISDNLVIDKKQTKEEKKNYLNYGQDLAVACYGYTNVKSYKTRSQNKRYCDVDGVLYTKDMSDVIAVPNHYEGELKFPENVIHLGNGAMWPEMTEYFKGTGFNKITKIKIPASMTEIDEDQLIVLNQLVDEYGTKIEINPDNNIYEIANSGRIKPIADEPTGIKYTTARLNIRTEPKDGKIVKTINPGERVKVVLVRHGWAQLTDGNWCSVKYLGY